MNKTEKFIIGILLISSLLLIVFNVDLNKTPCNGGCRLEENLK